MKTTLPKAPQPTEHQIQTAIIGYLRAKKWYVMRLNTGKYEVGQGVSKRYIMGQEKGTPDLMCFKPLDIRPHLDVAPVNGIAVLYFIEVKRPGKEPELAQVMKMNELEQYGARCIAAHSVEELEDAGL